MVRIAPYSRASGFTLLELIVALSVAALFFGLLTDSLGGLAKRTRQMLTENATQTETMVTVRFVNQALKSAIPPTPSQANSQFVGTSSEVSFNAVAPESMQQLGPLRFRFYSDKEPFGGTSFFVDAESLSGADQNPGRSPSFVLKRKRLLKNIQSASFRFYEKPSGETKALDQWNANGRLPTLIHLSVTRTDDLAPISISAMPRRHVDSQCRFDQVSLSCRY